MCEAYPTCMNILGTNGYNHKKCCIGGKCVVSLTVNFFPAPIQSINVMHVAKMSTCVIFPVLDMTQSVIKPSLQA